MRLPQINKQQMSGAMLAIVALMALDSVYQVGMHTWWRWWMPGSLALAASTQPASSQPTATLPSSTQAAETRSSATQASGSQPTAAASPVSQPDRRPAAGQPAGPSGAGPGRKEPPALSAAIKKRNIMADPKPKGHGLRLTGVLGTAAMFASREGQPVKIDEGQSGPGGVKVAKIDGYAVTIEYEGKPETMNLFAASGPGDAPGPGGPERSAARGRGSPEGPPSPSGPAGGVAAASQADRRSDSQPAR